MRRRSPQQGVHRHGSRAIDLAKIESLSKSFASVVIPVVLLLVGQDLAAAMPREIEAKFAGMATSILNKDPGEKPSAEVQSLRRWAVEIIDKLSGVPMPKETAAALIQSTPLPSPPAPATALGAVPAAPWAVVFWWRHNARRRAARGESHGRQDGAGERVDLPPQRLVPQHRHLRRVQRHRRCARQGVRGARRRLPHRPGQVVPGGGRPRGLSRVRGS
jgi:hypothetical protein